MENLKNKNDKLIKEDFLGNNHPENNAYSEEILDTNEGSSEVKNSNFSNESEIGANDSLVKNEWYLAGKEEIPDDEYLSDDFDTSELDSDFEGGLTESKETDEDMGDSQENWGEEFDKELEALFNNEVTVEKPKVAKKERKKNTERTINDGDIQEDKIEGLANITKEESQGLRGKIEKLVYKLRTRGKIVLRQSVAEDLNITEGRECELYILMEEKKDGIENYIAELGFKAHIYSDVEAMEFALVTEERPIRLLVLETAKGVFSNIKMRVKVAQLIGICDSKNKLATVYYCDPVIRSKKIKSVPYISWRPYVSTLECLENTKEYKEIYGEPSEIRYKSKLDILDKVANAVDAESIPMKLREVTFDFDGDTIRKYKVKY